MIAEYYTADSSSFSALELLMPKIYSCILILLDVMYFFIIFFGEGVAENYSHVKQIIVLFLSENYGITTERYGKSNDSCSSLYSLYLR